VKPLRIDKDIPIGGIQRKKYPLGELEIGDSFFVPGKIVAQITGVFHRYPGRKFSGRTVFESGVKGARIWRVA